jgi:hypothetical protein
VTIYVKRQPSAAIVCSVPTADDARLQEAWSAIRKAHPAVPDAEIRAVTSKRGSSDTSIDWSESRPLILIGRKTIEGGPASVLGWLLHLAAHAVTPGGGVTSAYKGRWHTAEWKSTAERFGLEVSGSAQSVTTLNDWVAKHQYADVIKQLGQLS